ncbi:hypothetical protein LINPERHAP1_LOCUS14232 [Linum perenne]
MDGSVITMTGRAVVGGVIINWDEKVLQAFIVNMGICTIRRAELSGAVIGLERAWLKRYRDVEIQMDSTCAIQLLSQIEEPSHQHAILVYKFMEMT